jgi:ferredoxin
MEICHRVSALADQINLPEPASPKMPVFYYLKIIFSTGKALDLYDKGGSPWMKTYLVYPLFTNLAIGKNSFKVTEACISCGLCERICPTQTIRMKDGRPIWADTCVQCVACIHRCPVHAIEYGKETIKKGRYHHPEIK